MQSARTSLYDPAGADLFSQTLTPQTQLAANHEVDGIEFFPRYFGHEEQRRGLSDPRECAPGDQANCIANSKASARQP